jgi:hypothetical protein
MWGNEALTGRMKFGDRKQRRGLRSGLFAIDIFRCRGSGENLPAKCDEMIRLDDKYITVVVSFYL